MAIGERIKRIRNFRNLTQKELGVAIGFAENTADVRIAQYESGKRTPKEKCVEAIAQALNVTPFALNVPDIESYYGVAQTLFAMEDLYGLKLDEFDGDDGKVYMTLDKTKLYDYREMIGIFFAWDSEAQKLKRGEITQEDYDNWRYRYPAIESERTKAALDALRQKAKAGDTE